MPGHTDKKDDKKKNGGGMSWISFVKAYAKKNNMKYNISMNLPYLTMIKKYKDQYILEGCSFNHNFKIIIYKDNLFDEDKSGHIEK